ncbi:hypothetical protein GGR51DRAFT_578003 [Nemania sp. FL0031]|nr:hypothetical protein GGR51DRAFT_578003 [Nemania sp. FL0031]
MSSAEPTGSIQVTDDFRPSIGVELEFLVCVAVGDQPLNVPKRFENSNGGPVLLPSVMGSIFDAGPLAVQNKIRKTIEKAVSQHRGSRVLEPGDSVRLPNGQINQEVVHLQAYRDAWTIGNDASVYLGHDDQYLRNEAHISEYSWQSVEIASPALWATDESWKEIQAVVEALKDEYWILTPNTAGMHYHYGNGKAYIPFNKLRRIAALLLAVDPIIVQLHPELRRENNYARSNRLYSRVAHGRRAAVSSRDIRAEYVEEDTETPIARPRPIPVSRPVRKKTAGFIAPFKRGELTGYKFSPQRFFDTGYDEDRAYARRFRDGNYSTLRPQEIPLEVREILHSINAPTVADLMRYGPFTDRPAYSFHAYTQERYKRPVRQGNRVANTHQNKRTIEFRQMASTMEADEVVAHGKVIVRLCQYAVEADLDQLWKLVLDCTVAEDRGDWFDVFDLLAELGLHSEARALQHPVARFRGEKIPDEPDGDDEEEREGDDGESDISIPTIPATFWNIWGG